MCSARFKAQLESVLVCVSSHISGTDVHDTNSLPIEGISGVLISEEENLCLASHSTVHILRNFETGFLRNETLPETGVVSCWKYKLCSCSVGLLELGFFWIWQGEMLVCLFCLSPGNCRKWTFADGCKSYTVS